MSRRFLVAILFLSCSLASVVYGQKGSLRSNFLTIDSLYTAGAYLSAEVEARRLLEYANLNDTAYAEIHKYIAFSLIAQGKSELAKERFAMVLSLFPAYSLDPVLTSPKILLIFNEAKRDFHSPKKPAQEQINFPVDANSSSVSYRAVLFPGWEQFYTGRKLSGTIFLSIGILTLGSGITCELLRGSARQEYLAEKNPSAIDEKYATYNRYYKTEIASLVAFALTYIASEVDVFAVSSAPSVVVRSNMPYAGYASLSFGINF